MNKARKAEEAAISVRYRSDNLIVVQKPVGVASQPGARTKKTIVDLIERQLGFRPLPVHRLDKETEGLLVLAKNHDAAARFARALNSDQVEKSYLAICAGRFTRPTGEIDEAVSVKGVEKTALTRYRVLRSLGKFSLLELSLGTGRMHQIRIHLAKNGRPIVGDDQHGDFALNRELKRTHGVKHLMLCAYRLRFPDGRKTITLTAELPHHMEAFLSIYNALDAIPSAEGR